MTKRTLLFILLAVIGWGLPGFAQHPGWSQYYLIERINCLADDDNFLWVGTDFGVVRINVDNDEETYYNTANSGLPTNIIKSITIDNNGTAYISTFAGLAVFDGSSWQVLDSLNTPLASNDIGAVAVTSTFDLWVASGEQLLSRNAGGEWTIFSQEGTGLPGPVSAIAIDNDDNILVGFPESILMFDGTSWSDDLLDEYMSFPKTILVDSSGKIWISTSIGIASLEPGADSWRQYFDYNSELEDGYITALTLDDDNHLLIGDGDFGLIEYQNGEGADTAWTKHGSPLTDENSRYINGLATTGETIWMGLARGLYKRENATWTRRQLRNAPLMNNTVYDVVVDQDNVKWFTPSGEGLLSFDGTTWTIYDTLNSEIPGNSIGALAVDERREQLWVATDGGIATFDGETWTMIDSTPNLHVRSIAIASDGTAWIASIRGLESFDGNQWTNHEYITNLGDNVSITDMVFDKTGTLWITTTWNGVVSFDGTSWVNYTPYNSDVPADWVLTVTVDSTNNIWIGTNYNMLAMFDGNDWTAYDVYKDPYYDNYVTSIAIDNSNTKWIGAQGSSPVYPLSTLHDTTFNVYNAYNSGLPQDRVHALAIDKQGTIWIASRGIYSYTPGVQVSTVKHELPSIKVTMFPNPSAGQLNFNTLDKSAITEIELIEPGGRLIKRQMINDSQGSLSMEGLPAGVYFLRFIIGGRVFVGKVIKH